MDSKSKASLLARTSSGNRAEDIVTLQLKGLSSIADYFVICSGSSAKIVQTIADECRSAMKERDGTLPHHIEGYNEGMWVLLDYGDVVLHIFYHQTRDFYSLEELWADAPKFGDTFL